LNLSRLPSEQDFLKEKSGVPLEITCEPDF